MSMIKIAIQGIRGSFSEVAATTYAKKHGLTNYQFHYAITSENVLTSIEAGYCDYGIFAIENSTGGVVIESIYALARHPCHIEELFSIPVEQSLVTKVGVAKEQITAIYSHSQALRQCKGYLATEFHGVPLIETEDTALAAQHLQMNQLPTTAGVVCNKICAELFSLQLMATGINDLKDNQTQFIAATQFKE